MAKKKVWIRWIAIPALVLIGLGLLIFIGGYWATSTDSGLDTVEGQVEKRVSAQIPGTLKLGDLKSIEWMEFPGTVEVEVTELAFLDPRDEPSIEINEAFVTIDVLGLLSSEIHIKSADLRTGTVYLEPLDDGRMGIEATFAEATKPDQKKPKNKKPTGAAIRLENLKVADLNFIAHPDPSTTLEVNDIDGLVEVRRIDDPGVRVELSDISGTLSRPQFLGQKIVLEKANGRVLGGGEPVVRLDLDATFGGDPITGEFEYFARKDKPVVIKIEDTEGVISSFAAFAANIRTALGGNIKIIN